ncbi:MAG: sugar ABC transporter ATP-binding protein [Thermaerobacter sp.]|nr:sugar ABC transporter ATP-binding protein [Thermaerobacter sp.]
MQMVRVWGISKSYGGTKALSNVSLQFPAHAVTAIVGENGAGKSTLIKILMGVEVPDSGYIAIDGVRVRLSTPSMARALGFAGVYQEPLVFPQLSVLENIFIAHLPASKWGNISRREMLKRVGPVFDQLHIPLLLLSTPMGELSLGFQQLVLIAQALVFESQLIIFDEPTSILSSAETEQLFRVIQQLREEGRIILYVSHRLDELSRVADRVVVLTDGTVVAEHVDKGWDVHELVDEMSGTRPYKIADGPARQIVEHAESRRFLEVENLTCEPDYRNVSFYVKSHEIVGFYGQVGAGRSEVMQTIFGARKPQSGSIHLDRRPVHVKSPSQAIQSGIAYLPEDRKQQGIFLLRSVTQNMMVSVLGDFTHAGGLLNLSALRTQTKSLIDKLTIKAGGLTAPIVNLSGGGQQKVLFARWLVRNDLKVAIFDEPTRGIDVATKAEIHQLIRELAEQGTAVIVVSSELPEIVDLCSRVYVMRQGAVIGESAVTNDSHQTILAMSIGLSHVSLGKEGVGR